MSSPAAARGREVRQRLLATAAELIPERGWTAVSTRVLADRAGVAPSVVHYHFPSLAALLGEAAIGTLRDLLAVAGEVLEQARAPGELSDLLLASVRQYTGTDSLSLLSVETYLAATRDPELGARLAALVAEFRQRLAGLLRAHRVPEPEATAAVLAATIDGLLLHRALQPADGGSPGSSGDDALGAVLRRLVTDRPQHD
ncbi:TetR/AcrR family transcriptional regulator [Streptomyces sp. NPDC058794]|uniref:TetR/AcrR family transcriptional regulator n=1 Tax=unclassified Streptomyces TaxID=2593676 RepID=UPI0036B6DA4C